MDEVLKKFPLHNDPRGFREDRNVVTALSNAVNYIEKHIYNDKHAIGVFCMFKRPLTQ